MHHLYPMAKGDPLCPLGFHPQVRWPTRCKRCFRDYKEHGNRRDDPSPLRRDEAVTASTPSLPSSWATQQASRSRESSSSSSSGIGSDSSSATRGRTSSSSSDLSRASATNDLSAKPSAVAAPLKPRPAVWTSTPDLNSLDEETTSVTIRMPPRVRSRTTQLVTPDPLKETPKATPKEAPKETAKPSESDYRSSQYAFRRRTTDLSNVKVEPKPEPISEAKMAERNRLRRPAEAESVSSRRNNAPQPPSSTANSTSTNPEVEFILRVKSQNAAASAAKKSDAASLKGRTKKTSSSSSEDDEEDDDASSLAGTETTETTIIDRSNDDEIMELKRELDTTRARCEKLEREKSDILLRRLAGARETAPSSAEALKLQQRVHELQQAAEDLRDEKHSLSLRVKELEDVAESAAAREPELRRTVEELRNKLSAAETLCEELMDENEEIKKEIRDLEEEIDEMQDNFREDQADEYSSLKKELDQTAKNCRILQFKLRKSERKAEALEAAKLEAERQLGDKGSTPASTEKVRALEKDLKLQSEVSERLQKEVESLKVLLAKEKAAVAAARAKSHTLPDSKLAAVPETPASKKKPPMLGKSAGEPVTRASLTRGGSQDDPVQLLRDLQDSMEREADLREQLRFAEEEGQNFRKKCSRLEDDNDSLAMQLKKMATKARSRRHSPSPARLTPEPTADKDEGISDDEDPAELRLQLELNEQEAAVMRRKVEDLEKAGEAARKQVKELQDKLANKNLVPPSSPRTVRSDLRPASSSAAVLEKKITVLEEESSELRKKLIEKERDYERLQSELTLAHKKKSGMSRSRSLDGSEQALDLKRQLQVIEQEAVVLRTRTQDLEAENEKLSAENKRLSIRPSRSRTPAMDAEGKDDVDMKEKLAALEKQLTEANNKVNELKAKKPLPASGAAAEVEKLRTQLVKLEKENEALKEGGSRLRTRTPKKPTDLTTKLQLKRMVEDLEGEVAELLVGLSKAKDSSSAISSKASEATEKQLDDLRKEGDKVKKELEKEKSLYEKEKAKSEAELKRLNAEKSKAQENVSKLEVENKTLKENVDKLKASQETAKHAQDEVLKLQAELEEARALVSGLQRDQEERIKEEAKKAETEKTKLQKEITEKTKKLAEAEKKAKEADEKLKKTERVLSGKKEKLAKAEKDLEAEREKLRQSEGTQKEVAVGWLRERDELKASVTEMTRRAEQLEEQLTGRAREVEALEGSLAGERARVAELMSSSESSLAATSAAVERQLEAAREELAAAKSRASDLASQLEKAEKAKRAADDKARKDITELQTKLTEAESVRTSDKQRLEFQIKEKEQEIRSLGNQLKAAQQDSGSSNKRVAEIQDDFSKRIQKLEQDLGAERQEYEELTARYELLEEEHVVTKAQLTMDRDKAESAVGLAQQELSTLEGELQTLRETYNSKQDAWIKEKLDMQEQVRELEEKVARGGGESWTIEKGRMKVLMEEKTSQLEQTKHELDVLSDQHTYLRKESEELRRKLDDFDRVSKAQRNMTADTTALDKEIKGLKSRLLQEEKGHKTEIAQLKLRYDSRVALISEELQSMHGQVAKFKRERDSTRHMLEAAQKSIGELRQAAASGGKITPTLHASIDPADESEETRTKLATLEQQLSCMEDELSDSRLEASKLKTELVSERSAWEVKLSEMQSRMNELEEDRLMSTGRMKIPGMRTRMELAWQKEREEQHRLLQETSTLARDLRQTLFEVERERDKERLEGKRKLDQLKKTMEEEMEENRKKITEMQYDLLELRDAHAKLRTTNEKLRRERERWEKDRDEQRQQAAGRKRQELDEERKINSLLEQVEELMKLAPELFPQKQSASESSTSLPVAPRRLRGPRSRESSPGVERKDYSREPSAGEDRKSQLQSTLVRLTEATNELRKYQRLGEEERDRERARRTLGFRRAASTEAEPPPNEGQNKMRNQKTNGAGNKKGGLFRKSLSLEQTSGGMSQEQNIWTGDDGGSMSSLQSLEAGAEAMDSRFLSLQRRDPSLDRLSTDSTQSEATTEKKKKKGILGKLKKLTKSRSIEDSNTGDLVLSAGMQAGSIGGSGSDISVDISTPGTAKKDMKERLAGMFKKGTSSRSSSVERSSVDREVTAPPVVERSDSLQRPLKNVNPSLSRPSPARSDVSQTSSASRPLAPTVAQQKPAAPANAARRYVR